MRAKTKKKQRKQQKLSIGGNETRSLAIQEGLTLVKNLL